MRTAQRAQPSEIPGLTVGDVEDQVAAPPLPQLFGIAHDAEDLRTHGLFVAYEERDAGVIGDMSVAIRALYLAWAWGPELEHRRELAQAALDEGAAAQAHRLERIRQGAQWQEEMEAHQRKMDALMLEAQYKTLTVLSDEDRAILAND